MRSSSGLLISNTPIKNSLKQTVRGRLRSVLVPITLMRQRVSQLNCPTLLYTIDAPSMPAFVWLAILATG